jgi:phosphoheptose isomerase
MTFPDEQFPDIGSFADAYFDRASRAAASVDRAALTKAAELLGTIYRDGGTLYVCGNGGSAAISNHLYCDHVKCIRADTDLMPKAQSLAANLEMITAIANDISYDEVFAYQLQSFAGPGDALMTISSSGDSENVVRAAQWAKDNAIPVISLTGFSGGRTGALADVHLHVEGDNYGVVEDAHQALMHILAQYLRLAGMDPATIRQRKF